MNIVCLDVDTILELHTEQLESDSIWPYPWEYYPFVVNGKRKWVRYQDLKVEHKKLIGDALNKVV